MNILQLPIHCLDWDPWGALRECRALHRRPGASQALSSRLLVGRGQQTSTPSKVEANRRVQLIGCNHEEVATNWDLFMLDLMKTIPLLWTRVTPGSKIKLSYAESVWAPSTLASRSLIHNPCLSSANSHRAHSKHRPRHHLAGLAHNSKYRPRIGIVAKQPCRREKGQKAKKCHGTALRARRTAPQHAWIPDHIAISKA